MAAIKKSNEPDTSNILNQMAIAYEDFHWTVYYNDYCLYHHGDKKNHDWFLQCPQEVKTKKQLAAMIQTLSELPKSPDLSPFVSINNKPNDKD